MNFPSHEMRIGISEFDHPIGIFEEGLNGDSNPGNLLLL